MGEGEFEVWVVGEKRGKAGESGKEGYSSVGGRGGVRLIGVDVVG